MRANRPAIDAPGAITAIASPWGGYCRPLGMSETSHAVQKSIDEPWLPARDQVHDCRDSGVAPKSNNFTNRVPGIPPKCTAFMQARKRRRSASRQCVDCLRRFCHPQWPAVTTLRCHNVCDGPRSVADRSIGPHTSFY